jgi:hypothetical protein
MPRPTRPALQPEARLLLAVLEDAVRVWRQCGRLQGRRAARLRAELGAWLLSDAADHPFAFASICEHLDIDPGHLRAKLALGGDLAAAA